MSNYKVYVIIKLQKHEKYDWCEFYLVFYLYIKSRQMRGWRLLMCQEKEYN